MELDKLYQNRFWTSKFIRTGSSFNVTAMNDTKTGHDVLAEADGISQTVEQLKTGQPDNVDAGQLERDKNTLILKSDSSRLHLPMTQTARVNTQAALKARFPDMDVQIEADSFVVYKG